MAMVSATDPETAPPMTKLSAPAPAVGASHRLLSSKSATEDTAPAQEIMFRLAVSTLDAANVKEDVPSTAPLMAMFRAVVLMNVTVVAATANAVVAADPLN